MVLLPSVSISVSASAMVCAIVASLSLCRAAEACARLNKKSPHKGYARMGPSERAEATREACDGGDKGATGATRGRRKRIDLGLRVRLRFDGERGGEHLTHLDLVYLAGPVLVVRVEDDSQLILRCTPGCAQSKPS